MDWLVSLFIQQSIGHTLIILCVVIGLGLLIGNLKVFNIGLGIAGVLFSGLIIAHFGMGIENQEIVHFIRDFGMILFVYSIGLQVGPSFLSSLYKQGLQLNLIAMAIVVMGVLITIAISYFGNIPMINAVGLFCGGTTSTPSLAAAQQALQSIPGMPANIATQPALGYAIAYPFGILGIIISMLLVQFVMKISPAKEAETFQQEQRNDNTRTTHQDLEVENPNLDGVTVGSIGFLQDAGAVVTRVLQDDNVVLARPDTVLHVGNAVRVVAGKDKFEDLYLLIGKQSSRNIRKLTKNVMMKKIVVTRKENAGKTISQLHELYDVIISRVNRISDVEFTPGPDLKIQYGDQLNVVGEPEAIEQIAKDLGNSLEQLRHPEILPIFIGIALGVILGSIPVTLPGWPSPIKLGLAGGPLLTAIFLSSRGSLGGMSWHLPKSSNLILREMGIVLFLAAVGLNAGGTFVETLVQGSGFYWMGMAAFITLIPLVVMGFIARIVYKLNFMTICGLLAGSMTDTPALAFANSIAQSNAPSISYATVYPLVIIMRIVSAQLLVQFFVH